MMTATLAVTLAFVAGCTTTEPAQHVGTDRAAVFDAVWSRVDRGYPYFDYKHVDWDSLGAVYRPVALAAPTDRDFARVVARMLAELRDMHVSLTPAGAGSTMRYVSFADTVDTHFLAGRTLDRYVTSVAATPHLVTGMVAPDVAYLRISDFDGKGWAGDVDRALKAAASAEAIVVDVRGNMGGNHELAIQIAGRFADHRRTFGYLRYRDGVSHHDFTSYVIERVAPIGRRRFTKPVYLLTNRRVFSSAEEFVMAMKVLPTVTVIGDTTGGASGGPRVHQLDNGWTFQFSEWMEFTVNGAVIENAGLPPDVMIKGVAGDEAAGRDRALERAIRMAAAKIGSR